jgi:anti-sigma factor RsiW
VSDSRNDARDCLDPETLAAYVDDRLDAQGRSRVEAHIAADPWCYDDLVEAVTLRAEVPDRSPTTC